MSGNPSSPIAATHFERSGNYLLKQRGLPMVSTETEAVSSMDYGMWSDEIAALISSAYRQSHDGSVP